MRATHVIATMLGIVAAASVAMLISAGFASSDQPPLAVLEKNLDTQGNIKVHEQGSPTVLVSSPEVDPLLVRDLDSPIHPFQRNVGIDNGCTEVSIPPSQRLVIEYVSALIGAEATLHPILYLHTTANGVPATHYIPVTEVPGAPGLFNAGQDVRIYADAGSTVDVCATATPAFGADVTISGHADGPVRR